AGRNDDEVRAAALRRDRRVRVLLQHRISVRSADAERADGGPARGRPRRPRGEPGVDVERTFVERDPRVGNIEVQARRNDLTVENEGGLDNARDARRRVEVADVRLEGADR